MADVGGQVYGYFRNRGLSPYAAAGAVGNFQQESSLNPNAAGGGLDQGQGPRAHGGGLNQQLDAIYNELHGSERGTLTALQQAKGPREAAKIFSERFERPGIPMLGNRERYAEEALQRYAGKVQVDQHATEAAHLASNIEPHLEAGQNAAVAQALATALAPQQTASIAGTQLARPVSSGGAEQASTGPRVPSALTSKAPAPVDALSQALSAIGTAPSPQAVREVAAGGGVANVGGSGAKAVLFGVQHLGKYAESQGNNLGPELNALEQRFGMQGAPWCFGAGTLISTPDGLTPIQRLRVGDLVYSAARNVRAVTAISVRQSPVLSLTAMGVDATTVTAEHPYWTRRLTARRHGREQRRVVDGPQWIAAGDLRCGDFIAIPDPVSGAKHVDAGDAYVVGRWLADGWTVLRKGRSVRREAFLCCAHHETAEVRASLDVAGVGYSERRYRTVTQFALRTKGAALVRGLGCGARSKRLPKDALDWCPEARRALLDGYFDGDGSRRPDGTLSASTVSRELAYGVASVARSLGDVVTIRRYPGRPGSIEGRELSVARWVYCVGYHHPRPDQRAQFFREDGVTWVPVRGVRPLGAGEPVWNMSVADDETFIADGVAVHNCAIFATTAAAHGGASHATRTASVAQINEWASQGSHGYERGLRPSSQARPGDLLTFGDAHVALVKEVHGGQIVTIEGNADGSGGVAQQTHRVGEGLVARPKYR